MERHETAIGEGYTLGVHLRADGQASKLRRKDGNVGGVKMERKRPKPRHPTKRAANKVKDLAKLLSELQQLRAQVQKAEAGRRLH